MATAVAQRKLVPLDSTSNSPNLFDGTTRLYVCLTCPYAQRAWSAVNYKCLQDIEILAIDLRDKPKWYTENVYPAGKVPSLEHNGKVKGESLDLLEYIDQNFGGPTLFPKEQKKVEAAAELLKFSDEVVKEFFTAFKNKDANLVHVAEHVGPVLDQLEVAFGKFESEGPFFLGQFSAVDLAYAPFVERFELLAPDLLNYDIYKGRPKLEKWFKVMKTMDAYTNTITYKSNELAQDLKKHLGR